MSLCETCNKNTGKACSHSIDKYPTSNLCGFYIWKKGEDKVTVRTLKIYKRRLTKTSNDLVMYARLYE